MTALPNQLLTYSLSETFYHAVEGHFVLRNGAKEIEQNARILGGGVVYGIVTLIGISELVVRTFALFIAVGIQFFMPAQKRANIRARYTCPLAEGCAASLRGLLKGTTRYYTMFGGNTKIKAMEALIERSVAYISPA